MKKIYFEGKLTGLEILKRNPFIEGLENDTIYHYIEGDPNSKSKYNGKIECEINRVKTDDDIKFITNQLKIKELNETINNREVIKSVLSEEQLLQLEQDKLELKTLLGY